METTVARLLLKRPHGSGISGDLGVSKGWGLEGLDFRGFNHMFLCTNTLQGKYFVPPDPGMFDVDHSESGRL